MKISLAQLNYHIGNFEENTKKIIEAINSAKEEQVDLIVFAELAICGYPPKDLLEFEDFIETSELAIQKVAKQCTGIAAIVGGPSRSQLKKGKPLHNSAYFLADGEVKSIHHKSLLPTYDVFDENRYFQSGSSAQLVHYKNETFAITICEDLWNIDGDMKYNSSPTEQLQLDKADFIINIAASPFSVIQREKREDVLKWNAKKYQLPIYYVNHIGAQTELIFDGGSRAIHPNGDSLGEMSYFKEETNSFNTKSQQVENSKVGTPKIERIHQALVLGVKDYFKKSNFTKALIGLSGGIDSAVTLAIAAEALGNENVMSVLMPSEYSSQHSIDDAIALCKNLQSPHEIVPIKSIFNVFQNELKTPFEGKEEDVTEENLQARIRGTLLMAYSNKFGNILLNTSNKSEMAVGYGTLYGDMCGGLSVIGDVYKTEVFELANYINRNKEIIPTNTITKPPSAELRPDQKDTDSLPEYELLDQILRLYIEERKGMQAIIDFGFNSEITKKIIRLVNLNEYKRFQAPPILRVSSKAFGMGRLMPLVGKYTS
jgi:NAD+ synthase (glutamine-hydrolysing)